jgi:hypothetical protein
MSRARSVSQLVGANNTIITSALAGSYTGVTGVGTLGAGSVPTSLVTGLSTVATSGSAADLSNTGLVKVADTGAISTGTSITVDNCFTTAYRVYKVWGFFFAPVNSTSTAFTGLRLRTGGASGADVTSGYRWRMIRHYSGHNVNEIDNNNSDPIFRQMLQSRYDYGNYYEWTIYSPAHANRTYVFGTMSGTHENQEDSFPHTFFGSMSDQTAHTGLRLYMYQGTTANISSGRICVYGVKDVV